MCLPRPTRAPDALRSVLLSLLLIGTAVIGDSRAEDCIDYRDYIHCVGGVSPLSAVGVAVVGDHAYVTTAENPEWGGGYFVVIDISNRDAPARVAQLLVGDPAIGITIAGHYAYVAAVRRTGPWQAVPYLYVIDISHATSPTIVSSVDLGSRASGVAVAGRYAYVVHEMADLQVIDISSPEAPMIVSSIAVPGVAVALIGSYAYIAGYDAQGIQVIDVSDPLSPVIVCRVMDEHAVSDIAVGGDYTYVAAVDYESFSRGLYVIDVSNPASPAIISHTATPHWPSAVAVAGGYACVVSDGLQIVDISNPASPVVVGSTAGGERGADVATGDGYAYLAGFYRGFGGCFQIIDISNRTSPPDAIGGLDTPGVATAVATSGSYAYVADWNAGLYVIDISNPRAATIVGSVAGRAYDVAVAGSFAYVVDGATQLMVIDVSDPAAPMIVGRVAAPNAYSVAVAGDYAYVAAGSHGAYVIDVSNPAAPSTVGVFGPGWSYCIAAAGHFVYAADALGGRLFVVDVSNPMAPVVVGNASLELCPGDVAIAGNYAYVALDQMYNTGFAGGLEIFDISNPASPGSVGMIRTAFVAEGVAVAGDYAYLANAFGDNGSVHVVDISSPAAPAVVGGAYTSGSGRSVALAGSHAYVACDSAGLAIFPVQCDIATPVALSRFEATHEEGGNRIRWEAHESPFIAFVLLRALGTEPSPESYRLLARLASGRRDEPQWDYLDSKVTPGKTYAYQLRGILPTGGTESFGPVFATVPGARGVVLLSAQPNPFIPAQCATEIGFALGERAHAKLRVFDATGRLVRVLADASLDAGPHTVWWDGRTDAGNEAGSGIYYYRLDAGEFSEVRGLVKLK